MRIGFVACPEQIPALMTALGARCTALGMAARPAFVADHAIVWVDADAERLTAILGCSPEFDGDRPHWTAPVWQPPMSHGVVGLNTRHPGRPYVRLNPIPPEGTIDAPQKFPDVPGAWSPSEILDSYGVTGPADGTGQTVAIAEWGQQFLQSDLDTFCREFDLPVRDVVVTSLDASGIAAPIQPWSATTAAEATLDVQTVRYAAPGAALHVYQMGTPLAFGAAVAHLYNAVLQADPVPVCLSVSYGLAEDLVHDAEKAAVASLEAQLTAKGCHVVNASGDQGSYAVPMPGALDQMPRVDWPGSCPAGIVVGATSLYRQNGRVVRETAWSNVFGIGATGAGVSVTFAVPPYQRAVMPTGLGGHHGRGIPDLCAVGDPNTPGYLCVGGQWGTVGGTSQSAPIIAGLLARIGQIRADAHLPPLAPTFHERLYAAGATLCRDITIGNNQTYATPGYSAAPGYDLCTGWGVPDYPAWVAHLGTDPAVTAQEEPWIIRELARLRGAL
jgi:kumamolisin